MKRSQIVPVRHRLRRLLAVPTVFAAVSSAVLVCAADPAHAGPAPSSSPATPSTAVQLFASEVETLGAQRFADSFAGATLSPSGITTVYALSASDGPLISAVDAINQSRFPVRYLAAPRSYNQLNALSAKLIAANDTIKAQGVTMSQSAPDPATGSVLVSVAPPSTSAVATLSADRKVTTRMAAAVTATNYRAAASTLLATELGQGYTVQSQYLPTATVPDAPSAGAPGGTPRMIPHVPTNDVAPFYGGDSIIANPSRIPCTGSFFVKGNKSGHAFLITAGHCSQHSPDDFDIFPTGTAMGPVSTNYWRPGTTNDFLTIYVPGGGLPYVWAVGNNLHPVATELLPAVGVLITFHGSKTGEVPHNTVTAVNATDMNVRDSNSGRVYNIHPVVQAAPPSATVSCQLGDSGGPAYQRTPGAPVDAIGSIAAFFGGPGITILCSAQQIGYEESTTNTSLMTTN